MSLVRTFLLLSLVSNISLAKKPKKPFLRGGLFEGHTFTPLEDFSDEFRGSFNHDKWFDINPRWKGRQPGLFAAKNVKQKRGKLLLRGRYEQEGSDAFEGAPDGYQNYTTAFVMTKKHAKFGYFEVKAKPGNSRLSSSFWGSLDTPDLWTEIDIFEIGGGAINDEGIDFRRRINMNLHVFRNKKKGIEPGVNQISKPTYYVHSSYLRSKFNVYGLDWGRRWITWTFNGRPIRRDRNRRWKQAFPMKFDVETMPNWFGLPSKKSLPATYKIKYIRAWSRKRPTKTSNRGAIIEHKNPEIGGLRILGNIFGNGLNSDLFSNGNTGIQLDALSEPDVETEEDETEEDDAETEVFPGTEPETNAPIDGLQRPPIPGSNEKVYFPVLPQRGQTWEQMIERINYFQNDIRGVEIDPDEIINIDDFDEELLFFRK